MEKYKTENLTGKRLRMSGIDKYLILTNKTLKELI